MAATDIPPTNVLLRIPGLTGDQSKGAFNVQSFHWSVTRDLNSVENPKKRVSLIRLSDGASPTIVAAFALAQTLGKEVVIAVVDGSGADIATWALKDAVVTEFSCNAALGGNERATEDLGLGTNQVTFTHAKTKRSAAV